MNAANLGVCKIISRSIILLLPLILLACSDSGLLPIGKAGRGEALTVRLEDIQRVQEIRFLGNDNQHYLVFPSSTDNELVALKLLVRNREANRLLMTVDKAAAELRGFGPNESYELLDLYQINELFEKNLKIVEGDHPAEDRYSPFLAGPFELVKGFGVTGWIVFEVPKGTKLREIRWDAGGDTIFIRS